MADHKQSSQRRYRPELREWAVPMVFEAYEQSGERFGVIKRVAFQLGIGTESLRNWARQAKFDRGARGGTSVAGDAARLLEAAARARGDIAPEMPA